jgi:alginate O-acetyltransferase complex protein AlgI
MIFTTYWFFAFTALCVLVFWLIPTAKFRLPFLAIACLVFHGHFAGPAGMAPIVVLMVVTFFCGLARSKAATSAGIVICVLALCFYKYTVFAVSAAVAPWLPQLAEQIVQSYRKMSPAAAPLGISFFVFEFVHYLVEVRRGGEPIRSPLKFLLFSIFFPSLVAGPIKRYQQFTASLEEGSKRFEVENLSFGLWRIALGFIKKVAIADNLTVLIGWNEGSMMAGSLWERWLFVGMVGMRILMDFSGYSDIAIGTARLLGIRLPENFNWPYAARSLQDFWQRWHISLSS